MSTLQINSTTGEVFFRLPAPHENTILTPPRDNHAADIVPILNNPGVYIFLPRPPVPHHHHRTVEWLRRMKNRSSKTLEDLRGGKTVVDERSVQLIREVQPDGTELFIDDTSVPRNGWTRSKTET